MKKEIVDHDVFNIFLYSQLEIQLKVWLMNLYFKYFFRNKKIAWYA